MRRVLLALSLLLLVLSPAGAAPAPNPFLDLQFEAPECTAGWNPFVSAMDTRGSGAIRCPFYPTVVADEYDALIWFDKTNPSLLLPFD